VVTHASPVHAWPHAQVQSDGHFPQPSPVSHVPFPQVTRTSQVPDTQTYPAPQLPQVPPHPSGPHVFPEQAGAQHAPFLHVPVVHAVKPSTVPHESYVQASTPQQLFVVAGRHVHAPSSQ
jgi:hypothetical protein